MNYRNNVIGGKLHNIINILVKNNSSLCQRSVLIDQISILTSPIKRKTSSNRRPRNRDCYCQANERIIEISQRINVFSNEITTLFWEEKI